jgi:hypothetical protein
MTNTVYEFSSQVKAQSFVRSLTRKGLEPGIDFTTKTKSDGTYCVYVYRRLGIFGA